MSSALPEKGTPTVRRPVIQSGKVPMYESGIGGIPNGIKGLGG